MVSFLFSARGFEPLNIQAKAPTNMRVEFFFLKLLEICYRSASVKRDGEQCDQIS